MKQPAYHLRSNKAVDRLTLIDAIRRTVPLQNLSEYTYYTLAGPYLEDCRIFYEFYPEIRMVSFETNHEIYRRQEFHLPCRSKQLALNRLDFKTFLARYTPESEKGIFWLDYTDLSYERFDEFMALLTKVVSKSVIKITLRCEPSDFICKTDAESRRKINDFQAAFSEVLPDPAVEPPITLLDFAKLLQEMVQIAAQKVLPASLGRTYCPICSFCYADGVGMFTFTGAVCDRRDETELKKSLQAWPLRNLRWARPRLIDVPTLSTKERLHLQRYLPIGGNSGRTLRRALGYLIDDNVRKTEAKLRQYADFHRYFPYFMKATP